MDDIVAKILKFSRIFQAGILLKCAAKPERNGSVYQYGTAFGVAAARLKYVLRNVALMLER